MGVYDKPEELYRTDNVFLRSRTKAKTVNNYNSITLNRNEMFCMKWLIRFLCKHITTTGHYSVKTGLLTESFADERRLLLNKYIEENGEEFNLKNNKQYNKPLYCYYTESRLVNMMKILVMLNYANYRQRSFVRCLVCHKDFLDIDWNVLLTEGSPKKEPKQTVEYIIEEDE